MVVNSSWFFLNLILWSVNLFQIKTTTISPSDTIYFFKNGFYNMWLDEQPVVLPRQLSLWQWMSDYYLCSIGEVFKAALPAKMKQIKKKQGKEKESLVQSSLLPQLSSSLSDNLPTLSTAQSTALEAVKQQWEHHAVCLLHGVTSSGKTEIYIHLIAEAIRRGEQVLYLLPEIVLTSQLTERLQAVFGQRLGVYHSKFTDVQRAKVWLRQLSSAPYDIIVGVRSSIFLPFRNLGLVIVDEEHEVNFKQQDPAPRYNARNVAILMASRAKARVLLGTATLPFFDVLIPYQWMADTRANPPLPIAYATEAEPRPLETGPTMEEWEANVRRIAQEHELSKRETEVFMYLARGHNAAYVKQELWISIHTAKTHIANVYHKLGVHSLQEVLEIVDYKHMPPEEDEKRTSPAGHEPLKDED